MGWEKELLDRGGKIGEGDGDAGGPGICIDCHAGTLAMTRVIKTDIWF